MKISGIWIWGDVPKVKLGDLIEGKFIVINRKSCILGIDSLKNFDRGVELDHLYRKWRVI
jgi:hypothetical protein